MANGTTRFMLTVPPDMAKQAEVLKKDIFHDKTYSEMYLNFIQVGIEKLEEKTARKK